MSSYDYVFTWGNNPVRKLFKGQRCRILVKGALQSVLVEFTDGTKLVTSIKALRPVSGLLAMLSLAVVLLMGCASTAFVRTEGWLIDAEVTWKLEDSTGSTWQRYGVADSVGPPYYLLFARHQYACRVTGLEFETIEIGRLCTCRWYLPRERR